MIFVTVGTQPAPFDRLLRALEHLHLADGEELVVQHGSSAVRPPGATCIDFLPYDAFVKYIRSARAVVAHAGVGSVMVTLQNGKRPFVVPRLQRFGEHPDDHQHLFARRLEEAGLVTIVDDPNELGEALARESEHSLVPVDRGGSLAQELRRYPQAELLGRSTARAAITGSHKPRRR